MEPDRPAAAVPADAWEQPTLPAALVALGVTDTQARAELEAMATNPQFHAGTVGMMRNHVSRAVTLAVALGLAEEGVMRDLWTEWQGDGENRGSLEWTIVKGADVQSFARHVQSWLRGLLVI